MGVILKIVLTVPRAMELCIMKRILIIKSQRFIVIEIVKSITINSSAYTQWTIDNIVFSYATVYTTTYRIVQDSSLHRTQGI